MTNAITGASVSAAQLQSVDLETAMMMVQSDRANNLETQLKGQLQAVAQRNQDIASLNKLMTDLRAMRPSGSDPEKWGNIGTNQQAGRDMYARVQAAGLTIPDAAGGDAVNEPGTNIYDAKQKTFDVWVEELKGKIDAASNSQQMDMLRLQSLSNKRNEAFEIMTNFVKKMSDSRGSIVGNMR